MTNFYTITDAHDRAYEQLHLVEGLLKAAFELQVEAASQNGDKDVQQAITACLRSGLENIPRAADALDALHKAAKTGGAV